MADDKVTGDHIVIDNGSGFLKMGTSAKARMAPEHVIPALHGTLREGCAPLAGMKVKEYYIGHEAV